MAENIYLECRKRAAKYNEALNSRASASRYLGVSASALTQYELGLTKVVPVDTVLMMADIYGAPELKANYCKHECPIGKDLPIATSTGSISEVTVRLLNSLDEEAIKSQKADILKIAADGEVDLSERERLRRIIQNLEKISEAISELKMFTEGALNNGTRR